MTAMTPTQAVKEFFDIRGDEMVDDDDIREAISDIGNDEASLPVVKTAETVADYRANGWQDHDLDCGGVVALRKQTGEHRTARGVAPLWAYVYIADCGDHRLVYVERD